MPFENEAALSETESQDLALAVYSFNLSLVQSSLTCAYSSPLFMFYLFLSHLNCDVYSFHSTQSSTISL